MYEKTPKTCAERETPDSTGLVKAAVIRKLGSFWSMIHALSRESHWPEILGLVMLLV